MAHVVNLNAYARPSSRPGFFARLRDMIVNNRNYLRIRDELNALNDRELADLGLSRLSVRDVALQSVYGR